MGSFRGHVVPGTLFLVVGLWHAWCSVYRYATDPKSFRVRVWNPVPGFHGRLKHLELYMVVIGAFFDLCIELLYSPHLKYFVNGELNPSHMNNFEHSGMLFMFFIFGLVALLSEKTRFLPLTQGMLCLAAATAFFAEYLLFYFHSTNHKGLEGYYHSILVLLVGLCVITSISGALFPNSFPLDLCNGLAIALQGLWFYQTAFTLYGPMMPDGCWLKETEIFCISSDSQARASTGAIIDKEQAAPFEHGCGRANTCERDPQASHTAREEGESAHACAKDKWAPHPARERSNMQASRTM